MPSPRKTCLHLVLAASLLVGISAPAMLAQSETTPSASCQFHDNLYTCDKASFERVLATAKTVAIETGPTDAVAQQHLKRLVAAMGKTLVPRGEHPDLTLLLVPVDPAGVQYTDRANLATLRVFAATPGQSGRGDLVWAENYNGDVNLEWPAVVSQLVTRFRTRFAIKH